MSLGVHTRGAVRQDARGGRGGGQTASVHTAGQCGLAGAITILSLAKAHRLKKNAEERKIQREGEVLRVIRSASCMSQVAMIRQRLTRWSGM